MHIVLKLVILTIKHTDSAYGMLLLLTMMMLEMLLTAVFALSASERTKR